MEGGGRRRGEKGESTEASISPLIQINGKILRLDADRLTVIWHTINLVSLSPLHPDRLLALIRRRSLVSCDSLSPFPPSVPVTLLDTVLLIINQMGMMMFY